MAKKVRIFAVILTMPKSKEAKAVHVKATWARRFNGYVFISSEEDMHLPSIREMCFFTFVKYVALDLSQKSIARSSSFHFSTSVARRVKHSNKKTR